MILKIVNTKIDPKTVVSAFQNENEMEMMLTFEMKNTMEQQQYSDISDL